MHPFNIVRLAAYGTALGFSLIVLGIGANFVAQTTKYNVYTVSSVPGFSVATPVLTMVILIPIIVIEYLRRGAVTSLVASELGYVGFLWILWLACASNATSILGGFVIGDCGLLNGQAASYCRQYQALQAFSWLNWLIFMIYWVTLLVLALMAHSRGNKKAFLQPTTELGPSVTNGGNAAGEPKIPATQGYPTYPQAGFPPGQYPPQTGQYPPQTGQYPQQTGQYPQQTGTYPQSGYPVQQGFAPGPGSSPSPAPTGPIQV